MTFSKKNNVVDVQQRCYATTHQNQHSDSKREKNQLSLIAEFFWSKSKNTVVG